MTNKERVIALLGFSPQANTVEGAMMDRGIALNTVYTYDADLLKKMKRAAIEIMQTLLTTADSRNAVDGGFDLQYDRDAVLKRIAQLESELEIVVPTKPTLKRLDLW